MKITETPLGQLPTLEIDGQVLHQSTAISRYVANLVGLTGKNPLENWEIDAVVDTITDLRDSKFFLKCTKFWESYIEGCRGF